MKKILLLTLIGSLFVLECGTALGETNSENITTSNNTATQPEITKYQQKLMRLDDKINKYEARISSVQPNQTNIDKKTSSLKQRASEEITRRINSLNKLIEKIQKIKKLNDAQKSDLINNLNTEIANLNTLNTKIQSDTDLVTLREDVKSIVTSYRIYLLVMPVSNIYIAGDKITNTADKLDQLAVKLQTRIGELENGEDKHNLETILADMQAKIADAGIQVDKAVSAVSTLQPTDFPGNKQYLQKAREFLQLAFKDLQTARQDAQKIIVGLRKDDKENTHASKSADMTSIRKIQKDDEKRSAIDSDDEIKPTKTPESHIAL